MVGGVSVAGFRPGFGRGGTIHSFLVTMVGVGSPDAGAMEAMLCVCDALVARIEGFGARAAGELAEEGIDIAGDAMIVEIAR